MVTIGDSVIVTQRYGHVTSVSRCIPNHVNRTNTTHTMQQFVRLFVCTCV